MNNIVESPEDIAKNVCDLIENTEFTAGQCSDIFRAIYNQNKVLGGKLWTTDDIQSELRDKYDLEADADVLAAIQNNMRMWSYPPIDEYTDEEWNQIHQSINDSDICILVTNIDWDTCEETESEPNLPSEVKIPVSEIEDADCIEDWLSDEYGYCINGFNLEKITFFD